MAALMRMAGSPHGDDGDDEVRAAKCGFGQISNSAEYEYER